MTELKPETELAILEAFARSKPYEFGGFKARYLEEHPEEPELVTEGTLTVTAAMIETAMLKPEDFNVIKKTKTKKTPKLATSIEAPASNPASASPTES